MHYLVISGRIVYHTWGVEACLRPMYMLACSWQHRLHILLSSSTADPRRIPGRGSLLESALSTKAHRHRRHVSTGRTPDDTSQICHRRPLTTKCIIETIWRWSRLDAPPPVREVYCTTLKYTTLCFKKHPVFTGTWLCYVRVFAVAILSVCRLSSVTFVHPTQPVKIFNNVLCRFVAQPSNDHHAKFYEDRPRETPPTGENARGIAKYSDVGRVECYISETVQDTASGTIND